MNGFKRDIKPKEDMNMKKNTETAKIPMINQVLKDAALGHLDQKGKAAFRQDRKSVVKGLFVDSAPLTTS